MRALIAARSRRDELVAQADAIIAGAENRAMTDDEGAAFDALTPQISKANAEIRRIEAAQEFERTAPATASYSGDGTQLSSTSASGVTRVHDNREDKPWSSMGEFLQTVAFAEMNPREALDPRLAKASVTKDGFSAAATGASQGIPADGGFLVGTQYSDALLDRAREESPILGMCRQIPIGAGFDSIELPVIDETSRATGSRWGGVQVYRKAEAATVTATKPTFGELKIEASEIMGLAYATERLLGNAPAMEGIFGNAFASEFAFKVTNEIISGVGGAECLGIVGHAPTIDQAKETGQAAATISTDNLSKMWMHVPPRSKSRGVWLINGECGPQLDKLSIAAGTGALEPRFVTYDQNGALRIYGRPVVELEQCSALGTTGDIIFADFNEYILSPKGSLNGQTSMHVRFLYNEMTFRWTYYINGRPAWLSSVTAFKGNASKSPFVTLATRA